MLNELKDKLVEDQNSHEMAHHAGQALAAIAPIEEWLSHLARHGYSYVLVEKAKWDAMTKPATPAPAPSAKRGASSDA